MLLQLLNHHQELFLAAIEPLIWRRDMRSLGNLLAVCKRLYAFINSKVAVVEHRTKFMSVLTELNNVKTYYCSGYANNVNWYRTIMYICNKKLLVYLHLDRAYSYDINDRIPIIHIGKDYITETIIQRVNGKYTMLRNIYYEPFELWEYNDLPDWLYEAQKNHFIKFIRIPMEFYNNDGEKFKSQLIDAGLSMELDSDRGLFPKIGQCIII